MEGRSARPKIYYVAPPLVANDLHLSFPLIQPFVAKLAQLAQFDKTSDAYPCMDLMNV